MSNVELVEQASINISAECTDDPSLWSLFQLLHFNAALFMTAMMELEHRLIRAAYEHTEEDDATFRREIFDVLSTLKKQCHEAGLASCRDQIERIETRFSGAVRLTFVALVSDLRGHIQDEFIKRRFFLIDPAEMSYHNSSFIDPIIIEHFPSASYDLAESGKCLTYHRFTASVCHSMRSLEVGLECFKEHLQANPADSNWGTILNSCLTAIRNLPNKHPRSEAWKEDQRWASECATDFTLFKDAWRNLAMHRKEVFLQGQATDILKSVCRFYILLSKRLSENRGDSH